MTLPPAACDDALAELYAALGRSLLQYLDEADPWTDAGHPDAKATLDRLAAGQRESFTEVSDLMLRRHVLPSLDTYPSEFASLHYLALDFLVRRLVADQLGVVSAVDAAVAACGQGTATRALGRVRTREAERFEDLRRLQDELRGGSGASPEG